MSGDGVMASDEAQAKRISDALRSMQEMWDHLRRKGLNEVLMREYSSALEVLEKDFMARLPDGVGVPAPAQPSLTPREVEILREIRLHAKFDGLSEGWQRNARNLLLGLERFYGEQR